MLCYKTNRVFNWWICWQLFFLIAHCPSEVDWLNLTHSINVNQSINADCPSQVDWLNSTHISLKQLHSKCLFVDHLPQVIIIPWNILLIKYQWTEYLHRIFLQDIFWVKSNLWNKSGFWNICQLVHLAQGYRDMATYRKVFSVVKNPPYCQVIMFNIHTVG